MSKQTSRASCAPTPPERLPLGDRAKRFVSQGLSKIVAIVVPYIYMAYMRFVWLTSRVEGREFVELNEWAVKHKGVICLLWHEEVFTVAYGYYYLGIRIHTLASVGDSGELIARMLKLCKAVVFRGGSTSGQARRREGVLEDLIRHMKTNEPVTLGLTVDGSKGPRYRMKMGGPVVARDSDRPIALVRTWYKRCWRLPTWDRMAVPLPFNRIRYYLRGPYFAPETAQTQEGLEAFRIQLENELNDLAGQSYDDMGQRRPDELKKREGESCAEKAA
ncbi:MAG: DUF374 domain-containing protein [Candidatus Binatia bacterium]|nr:DUF374 domain-containing protein [Candidatus Binatia bacterium]